MQGWFAENLTMMAPEPVAEAISTLRVYEDLGESVPEDEARKLARSCLVHLFATEPPQELLDYLRPSKSAARTNATELKKVMRKLKALRCCGAFCLAPVVASQAFKLGAPSN